MFTFFQFGSPHLSPAARLLPGLISLAFLLHLSPGFAQQRWCATYTCPNCAAHGAGPNTQSACFATEAECKALIKQNFSGDYYGSVTACTPSGTASGNSPDGSLNGLVRQSSEAIGKGIAYGNGQMVGIGMAGFGAALLLSDLGSDPQAEARAEQERLAREQAEREQAQRVQEEIMRQQELARQRIMHDLKDSTDSGTLQLKNDTAPLMVAQVDGGLGARVLVPVSNNSTMLGGMQIKGLDDSGGGKLASSSGFDTSGKLLGANAPLPDIATPAAAPAVEKNLTREQKVQQALQHDPDYLALAQKKDNAQKSIDDAQKKLADLQQQQQAETDATKKDALGQQITDQSKQLDAAKQQASTVDQQMKVIETKIQGSAEIVD